MLYQREQNRKVEQWIRYLMVDSSTQGGRDYELMVVSSIERGSADGYRKDALALANLRCSAGPGNSAEYTHILIKS